MFRDHLPVDHYLKKYYNSLKEIIPTLRADGLPEPVLNQQIVEMDTSTLEKEFGKYIQLKMKLKHKQEEQDYQVKLATYNQISDKIEAELKKRIQPEYIELIKQICTYEQTENHNPELVTAAAKLAATFKYNQTQTGKDTLNAATLVLENNSPQNRNQFLDLIDRNRSGKFKLGGFVIGCLLTFAGAAMIAAGIACAAAGVGFFPAYYLLVYGTMFVLPLGIAALGITGRRSYGLEETSLVNFGDNMIAAARQKPQGSSTAKIGVFSVKKEKIQRPDNLSREFDLDLNRIN